MKLFKKKILFLFIGIGLSFCASKERIQTNFPQEMTSVYFQKWTGGRQETGRGIYFHIEFKQPLSKEIQLEKIYFQNQVVNVERESDTHFIANFYQKPKSQDLILNGEDHKAPISEKPKFDLKSNQAILEYKKNNKTMFFKINNIKEKPMIAYP
ncbi:MAG: hypothetical protein ABWZ56_08425 [Flavobacterium sp.]